MSEIHQIAILIYNEYKLNCDYNHVVCMVQWLTLQHLKKNRLWMRVTIAC